MAETVRTRFAPSPTGYLHIGGARTALFNHLLAKQAGGQFLIRVEDTDQTRNISGAAGKLLGDLRWLGLDWDEGPQVGGPAGPYFQSERRDLYDAAVTRLLEAGQAYYAFDTSEELDAMRKAAQGQGPGFRYPRPERFPSEQDAAAARAAGRPVVVRLKMPDHDITVQDAVLGEVTYPRPELDDFVIRKNDGWPTYHLAVVVDDQAMGITHVLRGKEHLANTPKHMALQAYLGAPTPVYAHLPLIFNLDGSKMSKRDKDKVVRAGVRAALDDDRLERDAALKLSGCTDVAALDAWLDEQTQLSSDGLLALARALDLELPEIDVHDFRAGGYLPEVVVNFIALLGWSPGEDREKLTLAELIDAFSLDRIKKTDARFDREKLAAFNTDAAAAADPDRLLAGLKDYIATQPSSPLAGLDDATLTTVLELSRGLRTFPDVERKCGALFAPAGSLVYDAAAVKKWLRKGENAGVKLLGVLRAVLAEQADWSAGALEAVLRQFCEDEQVGLGKVAQPLRIAITGTTVSPAITDTLALVGRDEVLARIDRLLAALE